jgi:hypothetical protein
MKNPQIQNKTSCTIHLVSSRDFRGISDTVAGKPNTLSQNIWRQLRSPFLLPINGCAVCTDWEQIEYGKMGCLKCGSFHLCCVTTCPITEIENNHVCTITGAVVKTITYDSTEYLTTATRDTVKSTDTPPHLCRKRQTFGTKEVNTEKGSSRDASDYNTPNKCTRVGNTVNTKNVKKHTVSRCINFHERVCVQVLCSETTNVCYEKEKLKLCNRLRWSFMRHVRSFKKIHVNKQPNMIIMISKIAADIENYRLPITNNTMTLRKELAYICAQDIFRFTCSMTYSNAVFTLNLDPTTMVIGLLYLLRSGLVHKDMTVLPQYRSLTYLLPPENYINMFGVKSKIITECENIVKCHLRTLSNSDIKDIGYEAFDRVIQ